MPGKDITWTVDPQYESLFTPLILSDIVSGKIVSEEKVKRELAGRRVSFISLKPDNLPDVYLKACSIPPARIFRSFISPYGLKEWRMAQELTNKGIQTCLPIALGMVKRWGLYRNIYYITEAVPHSMTLKEYIEKYGPEGKRGQFHKGKDLIDQFADFVAGIRRVGVLHSDFHWGNVLIRFSDDGSPFFYLIDLHNVRLKKALSHKEGLSNLALLNASLLGKVPTRAQINFLKEYLKNLKKKREDFFRIRSRVKHDTEMLLVKKWKKLARRCLGENRYFTKVKISGLKGSAKRAEANALIRLMQDPDGLFFKQNAMVIKNSRTTASLLLVSDEKGSGIYLKRFNAKGIFYILKNMFRRSRAKKVWYASNSMVAREIPTPQPYMYIEERKTRALFRSYFVTEMIHGARSLDTYVAESFLDLPRQQKMAFVRTVALNVRKMHARGIRHGDLKAINILVQELGRGAGNIFFVDLDAARLADHVSFRYRCRDLARLNSSLLNTGIVSKTQRLYFLKSYLGRAGRKELKKTWATVMFFTGRKLRQSGKIFKSD